jgi:hypothetical protein
MTTDLALTRLGVFLLGALTLMLILAKAFESSSFFRDVKLTDWLTTAFTAALAAFTWALVDVTSRTDEALHVAAAAQKALVDVASKQTEILSHTSDALHLAASAQKASAETAEKLRLFTEAEDRAWIGPGAVAINGGKLERDKPITVDLLYQNTGKRPAPLIVAGLLQTFPKDAWHNGGVDAVLLTFEKDCMTAPMPNRPPTNVAYPVTGSSNYIWRVTSDDDTLPQQSRFVVTDDLLKDGLFALRGCMLYGEREQTHHSAFCFYYEANVSDPNRLPVCLIGQNAD